MKVEIKVPVMGESITEATVGALLKENGSHVSVDDELLELETDKVNQILYAQQSGTVSWNVSKDDAVKIGQVLGFIDTEKASAQAPPPKKTDKDTPAKVPEKKGPKEQNKETKPAEAPPLSIAPPAAGLGEETQSIRQSKEEFVAGLNTPAPSATSQVVQEKQPAKVSLPSQAPAEGRETRKKMSKIRKVISHRLVEALQQTAMLTTFNEVDMSNIMALRDSYKDAFSKKYQVRLGFMSFFIKASVAAMKVVPEINTYIDGDDIVYRNYFNISVAVGTDRGLVVPVIRDCDQLSFAQIEGELESYAKKAREGGLVADDLQGGGFTITNGGVYGSLLSTPILNMPQSAILGMHKIIKRPVVVNDQIVIRPMMNLALSYDHRVVDGKQAVSFLVYLKDCLEDPSRLLLEI